MFGFTSVCLERLSPLKNREEPRCFLGRLLSRLSRSCVILPPVWGVGSGYINCGLSLGKKMPRNGRRLQENFAVCGRARLGKPDSGLVFWLGTRACDMMRHLMEALWGGDGLTGPLIRSMSAEPKTPRRRSSRILLRIPLFITAVGSSENCEWEHAETLMVSLHGGMLRARQNFRVGDTLELRVRDGSRSARARVVWTSSDLTPNGLELGFEILDQVGFWEINFPPDRWSDQTRPHHAGG